MDTNILNECGRLSLEGRITFPQVVARLAQTGVERYHADLVRLEKTYYDASGASHVERMDIARLAIGATFSQDDIMTAIRLIQQGALDYQEFLRRVTAAGCVGYAVFITGRRAVYFGRGGDFHVERFPQST